MLVKMQVFDLRSKLCFNLDQNPLDFDMSHGSLGMQGRISKHIVRGLF